ncbi:MAG: 2-oxo acid dehydrogenase subunit E2 [Anaerolineae bacterium]
MTVELKMPQLGESVHEGTIGKWLKAEGEHVEKYEPLLEVVTDKVDTEITATDSGTLLKILASEGDTVAVGSAIAVLGEAGEAISYEPSLGAEPQAAQIGDAESQAASVGGAEPRAASAGGATRDTSAVSAEAPRATPVAARIAAEEGIDLRSVQPSGRGGQVTKADVLDAAAARDAGAAPGAEAAPVSAPAPAGDRDLGFISPRVARMAATQGVDLRLVPGTGRDGRITARDVEGFLASGAAPAAPVTGPAATAAAPGAQAAASAAPATTGGAASGAAVGRPASAAADGPHLGDVVPMTTMRSSIAEHMVRSKATSPHVSTVHESDMSAVTAAYRALKEPMARRGVKLTYTAFVVEALAAALADFPMVNSSWTADGIQIHPDINIGMAVAIPTGLIVPVIRNANELSLEGIAKAVTDLATRARNKQLTPDDVQGGTFTLTNYGVLGSLFGTPVINQPQAAILGTGAITKSVVAVETPDGDQIAIRPMMFLALTFDHRILDGGTADPFVQDIVRRLENYAL